MQGSGRVKGEVGRYAMVDGRRLKKAFDELARAIRPYLGTVVLVPVCIVIFGSYWTWERVVAPEFGTLHMPGASSAFGGAGTPGTPGARPTSAAHATYSEPEGSRDLEPREDGMSRTVGLWLYKDGASWERGTVLARGQFLDIELPRAVRYFRISLQANFAERYSIQGSSDGQRFSELWRPGGDSESNVLTSRKSTPNVVPEPIRHLRIVPSLGAERHSVSWLRLEIPPLAISHWGLVPVLWGLFALLHLLRRRAARWVDRVLEAWARWDGPASAVLVFAVLFETEGDILIAAGLVFALAVLVWVVKRWPVAAIATLLLAVIVFGFVLPGVVTRLVTARLARLYELNVDHRMRPFGMPDINSNGIRFRGEAAGLREDDFVILFLGDSFTYGFRLEYEQAYPYQFENIVGKMDCEQPVKVVNMGWTSASPLLALRLLEEIGYRYRPDLVLFNLDMTDFSDDLRYEDALRRGGDLKPDVDAVFKTLIAMHMPRLAANLDVLFSEDTGIRWRDSGASSLAPFQRPGTVGGDKFFVTKHPLERTRADIERGTMKHLKALHDFSTGTLGTRMGVVVYPRAYQYSASESPGNIEGNLYTVLGPYVREPFRYFELVSGELPYPVWSLLEDFEQAQSSPLYFEDDPHWNAAGAEVAARAVARRLVDAGWIPCTP